MPLCFHVDVLVGKLEIRALALKLFVSKEVVQKNHCWSPNFDVEIYKKFLKIVNPSVL